jgi:hypothetical protein
VEKTAAPTLDISPVSTDDISPTIIPENNDGDNMSDPQMERMIRLAKESLSGKFKISEDQIRLFEVKAVVWPDASLGCPQPEMMYAQVITPGYQIQLEAMGKSFSYHTDETGRVILCDASAPGEIYLPP